MLVLTFVLAASSLAWAQSNSAPGDWPQWRGPDRTGVSTETGLLQEWPKDGPKLLWKVNDLGRGYSTPSIRKGRIYLIGGKNDNTEEFLIALDANKGKQFWSTKLGAVGPNTKAPWPGTRSTPTIDGDMVFALGSDGDLVCAGAADGKERWRKQLRKDFGGTPGFWAYAESPLVDGDTLFCTPGGAKATLVALNKKSGDLIWKTEIPTDNEAPYSSAIIVDLNGIRQYVQYISGGVVGVDAKTGKLLWKFDKSYVMNIPTPIYHDGFVFVAAQGTGGAPNAEVLLKLNVEGMKATATEVYGNNSLNNHHGGIVRIGDYLYGTTANSLVCMDFKTGKVMWQNPSVGKGSITAADGHLYVRNEKGEVALVEATSAGYKEKGRFNQPDHEQSQEKPVWAHPVVAGGRLYLRDGDIMLCYDVKAP